MAYIGNSETSIERQRTITSEDSFKFKKVPETLG